VDKRKIKLKIDLKDIEKAKFTVNDEAIIDLTIDEGDPEFVKSGVS